MDRIKSWKLWLFFFLYTASVSAFVQLILLPYILPKFHWGYGIMITSFDSITFHLRAVDLANKMRLEGWPAWQLRPFEQGPAGISAIFYYFFGPDPRTLIPLNAALHASAALILVKILDSFLRNQTRSILCVLPFFAFPSSLTWTAQVHKDSYSILGAFLILFCMISLSRLKVSKDRNIYLLILGFFTFLFVGMFLIWIVRPFILSILQPLIGLFFSLLLFILFLKTIKNIKSWQITGLILLFTLLTFLIMSLLKGDAGFKDISDNPKVLSSEEELKNYEIDIVPESLIISQGMNVKPAEAEKQNKAVQHKQIISHAEIENYWVKTPWLPSIIDAKLYSLAIVRRGYRYTIGKSSVDINVGFNSVKSVLFYLPRAAQIAFLSPFPSQWFGEASYAPNSYMRKISALEMTVVYFTLIFLPYSIWYWRKRVEMWIILIFCTYMLLIYGLTVCNIGSLYRMRYGYITTLVALGIAGFFSVFDRLRIKSGYRKNAD